MRIGSVSVLFLGILFRGRGCKNFSGVTAKIDDGLLCSSAVLRGPRLYCWLSPLGVLSFKKWLEGVIKFTGIDLPPSERESYVKISMHSSLLCIL